ncbi:MAG: hypothetical protein GC136_02865 [Alphaproteobacteria bacterium]|nr:hypothetical protein [Alphaproteobacteria bacterium]
MPKAATRQYPPQRVKTIERIEDTRAYILGEKPTHDAIAFSSPDVAQLCNGFCYLTHYPVLSPEDARHDIQARYDHQKNELVNFVYLSGPARGEAIALRQKAVLGPHFALAARILKPAFLRQNFALAYGARGWGMGTKMHKDDDYFWTATFALGEDRPGVRWPQNRGMGQARANHVIIGAPDFLHESPYYDGTRAVISGLGLE